jgi:methionyl-tRNA formyltransferase
MLAGSVNSSLMTLNKMIQHECNVVGVLCLDPKYAANVSGYQDLVHLADEHEIPTMYFRNINDDEVYQFSHRKQPDYIFVVGLSQIVREPMLSCAVIGNVGFHPTRLPNGRGRGAIAWLVLGKAQGAATFFLLDDGVDSGPILNQVSFDVGKNDYASDVVEKVQLAISDALDELLPSLNDGSIKPCPQDHAQATYLGRRIPKDGEIDWNNTADEIYGLIRATAPPLPGAFSYWAGEKLTITRARIATTGKYHGVPGRIMELLDPAALVACSEGAIWLEEYTNLADTPLKVGYDLEQP